MSKSSQTEHFQNSRRYCDKWHQSFKLWCHLSQYRLEFWKCSVWDDLDISGLDIWKKLGNQISYWYLFHMYISCHSRNAVYLQCHCQIKPKTGWRYNDAEPRASTIPFSSKTHTNHRFLLWGLPEKCLPLGFSSPIQENPGTSWEKQGVCHWKFSCAWPNSAPFPE